MEHDLSSVLLFSLYDADKESSGRNVISKNIIESYDEWVPELLDPRNPLLATNWDFKRSQLFFKHRNIKLPNNLKVNIDENTYNIGGNIIFYPTRVEFPPDEFTPNIARISNDDYNGKYFGRFYYQPFSDNQSERIQHDVFNQEMELFNFPIMIGSRVSHVKPTSTLKEITDLGECVNDGFGYFIQGGNEKTIMIQEKTRQDMIYLKQQTKAKKKKNHEMIVAQMISHYLQTTRLISIFEGSITFDARTFRYEELKKQKEFDTEQYRGIITNPSAYTLSSMTSLHINLNCFSVDGAPLLPFMTYFFSDILFTETEKQALRNINSTGIKEVYAIYNNAFFNHLKYFVDPMLHQKIYNLLQDDIGLISKEFNRPEYALVKDNNLTKCNDFFYLCEDYLFWKIRPQNIDTRFVIGGNYKKAGKKFGAIRSDGLVDRSKMMNIITENFILESPLSNEKDETRLHKRLFFTTLLMCSRLVDRLASERGALDDLNDLSVRRYDIPGKAFEDLINKNLNNFMDYIEYDIFKVINSASFDIKLSDIGNIINDKLKKNIGMEIRKRFVRSNTIDVRDTFNTEFLKRENMLTPMSDITAENIPISRETKGEGGFLIRILKPSEAGFTAPDETPERAATGLTKHKAMSAIVSLDRDPGPIERMIRDDFSFENPIQSGTPEYKGICMINGKFLGWGDAKSVYEKLIMFRRTFSKNQVYYVPDDKDYVDNYNKTRHDRRYFDIGITIDNSNLSLHITTDAGRAMRPLLIINPKSKKLILEEMLGGLTKNHWDNYVEKLDQSRIENLKVEYTEMVKQRYEEEMRSHQEIMRQFSMWLNENKDFFDKNPDRSREAINNGPKEPLLPNYTLPNFMITPEEKNKNAITDIMQRGAMEYISAGDQFNMLIVQSIDDMIIKQETIRRTRELFINMKDSNQKMQLKAKLEDMESLNYTHCEVNPVLQFGYVGGSIPRANSMQGPRNTLEDSMAKQALGTYHSSGQRFDAVMRSLAAPTRPIFEPETARINGLEIFPTGEMGIGCISSFLGQTQEDSSINNQQGIDYGSFSVIIERTKKKFITIKKKDNYRFVNPYSGEYKNIGRKMKDRYYYRHLGVDGLPLPRSYLVEGDAIIGCISQRSYTDEWEDESIFLAPGERGFVEDVFVGTDTKSGEGKIVVKVKFRVYTTPQNGDKFAFRYSQKDTIGETMHPFDLPHTKDGMIPNFFMNPHSIPARMTVGMMIEFIASRLGALSGKRINATSYKHYNHDRYLQNLINYDMLEMDELAGIDVSLQKDVYRPAEYEMVMMETEIQQFDKRSNLGTEPMFDPMSEETYKLDRNGGEVEEMITIGPVYNRFLRHMTLDKFQVRARGKIKDITRAAVSGRGQGGATKFGEMENNALMSQGCYHLLYDRTHASGEVVYQACGKCGMALSRNIEGSVPYYDCIYCSSTIPKEMRENRKPGEYPYQISLRTRRVSNVFRWAIGACGIKITPEFMREDVFNTGLNDFE